MAPNEYGEPMPKRRSHGEGSIFYDQSRDRWVGLAWIDGRRRKVSAKTKTDAAAKLGRLLHGDPNERHVDQRLSVARLLEDWLTLHLAAKSRAPATHDAHRWAARIITAEIGKVKVANLDAPTIEKMYARLAARPERPLTRGSLLKLRSTLRQALAWGERRRIVTHNAAAVAEVPSAESTSRPRRALTENEVDRLVEAMGDHPYRPIWLLSLRLGLRPGEAAGVCVDALDLDGDPPTAAVVRAVRLESGRPALTDDLKTDAARRTLAMPAVLVDELRPIVAEVGDGLLVTTTSGGPVWRTTIRAELAKVAKRAGIGPVAPNELRHTAATRMADSGVPPHVVADVLGHTTTRMVDAVYRHRPAVIRGADEV